MRRLLLPLLAMTFGSMAIAGSGNNGCTAQAKKAVPNGFEQLFAQHVPTGCLVVSNLHDSYRDKQVNVQLLNSATSTPKGRLMLDGNAFGNDSDARDWGIVKGVLWMQGTASWEMWFSRTYGINLTDEKVIWNEANGSVIRVDPIYIVMTKTPTNTMFAVAEEEHLTVFDFDQRELWDDLVFTISAHPLYGDTTDLPWEAAVNGGRWTDRRFLYAQRRDKCGPFVARFDWHGPTKQQATVFPK